MKKTTKAATEKSTESPFDLLKGKYEAFEAAEAAFAEAKKQAKKIVADAETKFNGAKAEFNKALKPLNKRAGADSLDAGQSSSGTNGSNGRLAKNERKVLEALAGVETLDYDGIVKETDIKNPSSVIGKVRGKGWIEGKGKGAMFKITEAGRTALNPAESSDAKA